MTRRSVPTAAEDVQRWFVDLVRVGAAGNGPGVRQLANRLVREVPGVIQDVDGFRASIGEALSAAAASAPRRSPVRDLAREVVPQDIETSLPVAVAEEGFNAARPCLPDDIAARVEALLAERSERARLQEAGLEPASKVLLSGPPGVGKTMTARYLAARLDLPLVTVDLATVMSSYLGRTGQNLRAALHHAREAPSVVLLDEFDALAKRRDDHADIGELKRLVNVLLMELERWPSTSLLVAATNHRHLLDGAVERRFDVIIELGLPDEAQRGAILRQTWIADHAAPSVVDAVAAAADGASGSDLVSAAQSAAKRVVLSSVEPNAALLNEVTQVCRLSAKERDRLIVLLHNSSKVSNRELAALFGVSHPTIGAALKRSQG